MSDTSTQKQKHRAISVAGGPYGAAFEGCDPSFTVRFKRVKAKTYRSRTRTILAPGWTALRTLGHPGAGSPLRAQPHHLGADQVLGPQDA